MEANDTNNVDDIYRLEVSSGQLMKVTGLASVTNDLGGSQPSISGDGRFVAFTSGSNFNSNDTNGRDDVYRRDMNSSSVGAFVRVTGRASLTNDLGGRQPSISGDGRFVAFTSGSNFNSNDTNGRDDVYRRDMNSSSVGAFVRVTGRASLTNDLGGSQPSISGDGRFVAFTSGSNFNSNDTNGLEDVYRRDTNSAGAFVRVTGRASLTNDLGGRQPSISGDGRFVAFTSGSNFDSNDTNGRDDVYRRDMNSSSVGAFVRVTGRASLTNDLGGSQPSISGDGRFVAFTSGSNFDSNDTNGLEDVYRRDMNSAGAFVRVTGRASLTNDLGGRQPSISGDGRFVAFTSGSNFDSNDTNGRDDVYRREICP